jgi:hypothetical protein
MPPPAPRAPGSNTGFDHFDLEEAAHFRRDVQGDASALKRLAVAGTGTGAAVYGDDDDLDDEVGPQPMAKPKEYKEEKHVRDSCSSLHFDF